MNYNNWEEQINSSKKNLNRLSKYIMKFKGKSRIPPIKAGQPLINELEVNWLEFQTIGVD